MALTRVYLPLTESDLRDLRSRGEFGAAPVRAHAATESRLAVRGDEEEREYAAWLAAADDAAAQLGENGLRVVASADVDEALVARAPGESGEVEVGAAIPLSRIVSFHIDEQPGGPASDLLWYDVTELDDVLDLVCTG